MSRRKKVIPNIGAEKARLCLRCDRPFKTCEAFRLCPTCRETNQRVNYDLSYEFPPASKTLSAVG